MIIRRVLFQCFIPILAIIVAPFSLSHAQVPSPEENLGFKPGASRTLATWAQITDYFQTVDRTSEKLQLEIVGTTTQGKPLLMAVISSPQNLKNLTLYKNLQEQAANPGQLTSQDIQLLAKRNKAVVMAVFSTTSTHIASSQSAPDLAYTLITDSSGDIAGALNHVIFLLIPSLNPDGVDKIAQWYNKYINTPYERSLLPERAHEFAGDEIDFDWLALSTAETRAIARLLNYSWHPHVVLALTGMQSDHSRAMFELHGTETPQIPSGLKGNLTDLLMSALDSLKQQLTGLSVKHSSDEAALGRLTFHSMLRNILGLEIKIADSPGTRPLYFARGSLFDASLANSGAQIINKWQGGWWRLRDIIHYETTLISTLLQEIANKKEKIITNYCTLNQQFGSPVNAKPSTAFYIPHEQVSKGTTFRMLDLLLSSGIEVYQATADFQADSTMVHAGEHLIFEEQPRKNYLNFLFAQPNEHLPSEGSDSLQKFVGGSRFSLPLAMIVSFQKIKLHREQRHLKRIYDTNAKRKRVLPKNRFFMIDDRDKQSYQVVNRLLARKKKIYRLIYRTEVEDEILLPGTFLFERGALKPEELSTWMAELSIKVSGTNYAFDGRQVISLKEPRIAVYQPWSSKAAPGWLQHVLQQNNFRFEPLYPSNFKRSDLAGNYDALILPDMPGDEILNGAPNSNGLQVPPPRPYLDGISDIGLQQLRQFVNKGGTLIVFGRACSLISEYFDLPVDIVTGEERNHDSSIFWDLTADNSEVLAFGLPPTLRVSSHGPILRPRPWIDRIGVAAYYPKGTRVKGSNLDIGEHAAALNLPVGNGRVLLLAMQLAVKTQTLAAHRFLANGLYLSRSKLTLLR